MYFWSSYNFLANVNFHLLGFSFLKDAFGLFTSFISTTSSKEVDKKQWFIKRLFMLLCQSFCSAEMHPLQIKLFDSINIAVWLMMKWIWFHVVISRLSDNILCHVWTGSDRGLVWSPGTQPWSRETQPPLFSASSCHIQHSHCLPPAPSRSQDVRTVSMSSPIISRVSVSSLPSSCSLWTSSLKVFYLTTFSLGFIRAEVCSRSQ